MAQAIGVCDGLAVCVDEGRAGLGVSLVGRKSLSSRKIACMGGGGIYNRFTLDAGHISSRTVEGYG